MTTSIHGPGILFVRSRIAPSAKGILDEETFLKWYDEEHIAEVVATSGITSGFRYVDLTRTSAFGDLQNPKPFLAFYPLQDLAFTQSEEFRKVSIRSDKLPGSGIIYDLADFDVSYLGLISRSQKKQDYGNTDYIVTFGVRRVKDTPLASSTTSPNLQHHHEILLECPDYIRTSTFELRYARTNAQSRILKGLPPTDEPASDPPTLLAIHEFSSCPDPHVLQILTSVVQGFDRDAEVIIWKLARVHGQGTYFE